MGKVEDASTSHAVRPFPPKLVVVGRVPELKFTGTTCKLWVVNLKYSAVKDATYSLPPGPCGFPKSYGPVNSVNRPPTATIHPDMNLKWRSRRSTLRRTVKSSNATQEESDQPEGRRAPLGNEISRSPLSLFNLKRPPTQPHISAYRPFESSSSSSLILAAFPGLARDLCACIKGRSGRKEAGISPKFEACPRTTLGLKIAP